MKKIIALVLALISLLTLGACAKQAPQETSPASTAATVPAEAAEAPTEETAAPTEPDSEPGILRADLRAVWTTYQRGDTVTVIGKWGTFYIVQDAQQDHLVEEAFLRLSEEALPEAYTGWSTHNMQVYASANFHAEPIATLGQGIQVQVLDGKAGWLLIEWADGSGYVRAEDVKKWRQSGGAGGGSGNQDGSDVDLGSLSAFSDGFRLTLLGAYEGPEYEELAPSEATILSDGTEGYWKILPRDDTVKVTAVTEEECTLYLGTSFVQVPRWMVRLETEAPYTSWEAYARWSAKAYAEYTCTNELEAFRTNQRVSVVDELTELGLYVIQLESGFGYVDVAGLSKTPVATGGGGGSGNEWTPPAL